ncbi:MAG: biotin/lipoyl-binding protein [Methylotenera sp.]|nr:biotin/lipoyl-binding protein [Oligoflexia bacterium]
MSSLKGKVGSIELTWKSAPRGATGKTQVEVGGKKMDVQWRKDSDGIWIELANGVYGFDISGEPNEAETGLKFKVSERGTELGWENLSFVREGEELVASAEGAQKKGVRVRAQMPGKIIRVLIKQGDEVQKDQPLLVMEAMKMENEIRAPHAGKIAELKVTEGQAVESGAHLIILE